MEIDDERDLRDRIFAALDVAVAESGSLSREELWDFVVDGSVHRLIDRNRGIRNPKEMNATLSILSKPDSPYEDENVTDTLFAYAYREGSTDGDNRKLRQALTLEMPLILLRWIEVARRPRYVPVYPVYVAADDRENRRFLLALDRSLLAIDDPAHLDPVQRRYAEQITRRRLHQPEFRGRVLFAYRHRCAACGLGHGRLLDAAHIIGDRYDHGTAAVDNGLSLCKLHHAAFDADLIGFSPDYRIKIGPRLRDDRSENPMLRHGLQELHDAPLLVPDRSVERPSRDALAERFSQFEQQSRLDSTSGFRPDISWPAQSVSVESGTKATDRARSQ